MSKRFFNPYPKYLQVREMLVRRIEREMSVGSQLPTETRLSSEFGVSRETIREALKGLEEDGMITRQRGQGTFVSKLPPALTEHRLTGMSEDFSDLKFNTEAKVLEKGPIVAPPAVEQMLRPAPTEMIYRIARLRHYEGTPFAHHEAFMSLELGVQIAKLDLSHTSVLRELRGTLGLEVWEDYQRIEAQVADTGLAEMLDIAVGAPLLYIVRHFLDEAGHSVVLFRSHYRADRYYYSLKLAS